MPAPCIVSRASIRAVAEALMRSVMRRRRTGRAIASPVAVFVVTITSAIAIASGTDGRPRIESGAGCAKHAAEDAERSEAASAARSAREDGIVAATPWVGNETGRATVPLRG